MKRQHLEVEWFEPPGAPRLVRVGQRPAPTPSATSTADFIGTLAAAARVPRHCQAVGWRNIQAPGSGARRYPMSLFQELERLEQITMNLMQFLREDLQA